MPDMKKAVGPSCNNITTLSGLMASITKPMLQYLSTVIFGTEKIGKFTKTTTERTKSFGIKK